jgi:hypothetical protein
MCKKEAEEFGEIDRYLEKVKPPRYELIQIQI